MVSKIFEDFEIVLKTPKIPRGQLYVVPHGILRVFNTILYENEFQNPQIFQQTISLFPEHGGCGGCGGWGGGVVSPCVRTFQGLHSVRL
jgi:hypothetical protein